jgi:hypothetical protein
MIIETVKAPDRRFRNLEDAESFISDHVFETHAARLGDLTVNEDGRLQALDRVYEPVIETFPSQLLKAAKLPRGTFNANVPHDEIRDFVNAGLHNADNGRIVILTTNGRPYQLFEREEDATELPIPYTPDRLLRVVIALLEAGGQFSGGTWNNQGVRFLTLSGDDRAEEFIPGENFLIGQELLARGFDRVRLCALLQQNSCTNSTILADSQFSFGAGFGPDPDIVYESLIEWGKQFTCDMGTLGTSVRELKEKPLDLPTTTRIVNKTEKAAGRSTAARILGPFIRTSGEQHPRFVLSDSNTLHLTERGKKASQYNVWYELTRASQNLASMQKRISIEELAYQFLDGTISRN